VGADCVFYFFWTWHRGRPELLDKLRLRKIQLSPQEREAKLDALEAHRSQFTSCGNEPPVLPENLLWPAQMEWEVYLP
jgi:LmbE family N-acetylglucosaminyl deacetylase